MKFSFYKGRLLQYIEVGWLVGSSKRTHLPRVENVRKILKTKVKKKKSKGDKNTTRVGTHQWSAEADRGHTSPRAKSNQRTP